MSSYIDGYKKGDIINPTRVFDEIKPVDMGQYNTNYSPMESIDVTPEIEEFDLNEVPNEELNDSLFTSLAATAAVTSSQVFMGVLDVFEALGDGVIWTAGKVVDVVFNSALVLAVPKFQAELNHEKQFFDSLGKRLISYDWTEAMEEAIFATELGREVDQLSYIKVDSQYSDFLQGATTWTAKLAIATGAVIASGGTAAAAMPELLGAGFLTGVGEQSERVYSEETNAALRQEFGIVLSGATEAASFYALGRLGSGLLKLGTQVTNMVTHGPYVVRFGTSNNIFGALHKLWETRRRKGLVNAGLTALTGALTSPDDLIDVSRGVFQTLSNATLDDTSTFEESQSEIIRGVAINIFTNALFNNFDYFGSNLRTPEFIQSLDKEVLSLVKIIIKTADAGVDVH